MSENDKEENSGDNVKEDTVNSNSSFDKDLQEKYEEHKKSETKIPHRPTSSYTANRNINQAKKEMDSMKEIKNKPQSAHTSKSNSNSKYSNRKDPQSKNSKTNDNNSKSNTSNEIGVKELLNDLNKFIYLHKIKKSDFIDNPDVFLNFDDFCDVFKQIHYTLSKKYIKMLFNYNNPEGASDNYILMSNFIKYLNFYKIDGIANDSQNSNMVSSQSNSHQSNPINFENKSVNDKMEIKSNKSLYELKYINEQYNQFNKDIVGILKRSNFPNKNMFAQNYSGNFKISTNSLNLKKKERPKNLSSSKISIESKQKEREKEILKEILDSDKKETEEKKKYDINEILKVINEKEEKEDNYIRFQFDKRDKNFLKDCVYKCEECNRICNLLNKNRNYSVAFDEEMKCRIQEEGKKDEFISLKELTIEWRRLYKLYHQKEILEKYKENDDINKNKNVELLLNERKKEKEEKHREIKEVLIEAVRLKTKLKSQLDDLKSNIKIDEKVVLEHLSRAGMDIPNFKNKEKSKEKKGNKKEKNQSKGNNKK